MQIKIQNQTEASGYIKKIDSYVAESYKQEWIKYVILGSKTVRLINYSSKFTPLIQKQLSYTLKDSAPKFDATIIVWNEENPKLFSSKIIDKTNTAIMMRIRLEKLMAKREDIDLHFMDESYSKHNPLIKVNLTEGIVNAYDKENNTYYYGVEDLTPEEFIKQGHIFVQMFNRIAKTPNSNLVHGAAVGLNGNGILFCARGQRGKSTLAVLSMMQGFEYVSDDYLILEKEGETLYSYPIYSIITLSPRMYNELYYDLKGKFVSNNARKDKYVVNIDAYHDTFKDRYPINVCMFPEIVTDAEPSIVPCKKGRSVTQLIHSTIRQTEDGHDIKTIQKLIGFVDKFDFYQINLCSDIEKNVACLRNFCDNLNNK